MSEPYLISYDLDNPGQNYEDLQQAIKDNSTAYYKYQKSSWLVRSNLEPSDFYEQLKSFLDTNDKILITKISKPYYGQGTEWDWIEEHIYNP
ncbi:MAG: hypothetical protein ABF619_06445 [Oenococcus oeni]